MNSVYYLTDFLEIANITGNELNITGDNNFNASDFKTIDLSTDEGAAGQPIRRINGNGHTFFLMQISALQI